MTRCLLTSTVSKKLAFQAIRGSARNQREPLDVNFRAYSSSGSSTVIRLFNRLRTIAKCE
jgi:hypothetical protein